MKKAKEKCSEIEENLRKNNGKRAYELVKNIITVKQGKATTVQDRSGKCLTEELEILNRWTEYCSELYKANGEPSVLDCPRTDTEDDHPIPLKQQYRRLVPNNSWSTKEMSTITHPLQHISRKDHDRRLRRS